MLRNTVQFVCTILGAFAQDEDCPLLQTLDKAMTNIAAGLSGGPQDSGAPPPSDSTDPLLLVEHLERIVNEESAHIEKHGTGSETNAKLIEELTKSLESMVQVPAVEAKEGERLYYQYTDPNPVRAGRTVVDKVPCEFMARFDYESPTNSALKLNSTHFFLPFSHLKGTFARYSHYVDSREFGVLHLTPSQQAVSLLSDAVQFAVVAKAHTLTHTGGWPTTSLDNNRETQAHRLTITNAIAKQLRKRRAFLTIAAAMLYPRKTRYVMMDPLQINASRDFVESNGRQADDVLVDMEKAMASFMKQQRKVAEESHPEPSSTSYDCHHFESGPGVEVTDTGVWVPFNQKVLSYNFQAHMTPLERIAAVVGPGVWRHNEAEHTVEYYYAGSSCFEELSTKVSGGKPAMLYLSPPNLDDGVVGPDSRLPSATLSGLAAGLGRMANSIPIDFTWLYEDHATSCPEDVYNKNQRQMEKIDLFALFNGEMPGPLKFLLWAKYMADAVDCAAPVLSGSTTIPYANGFDGIETLPYLHSIIEAPPARRLTIMAQSYYYDTTLTSHD